MGWVCHCVALLALAGTGSSWPADLDKSFAQPEMAARPCLLDELGWQSQS